MKNQTASTQELKIPAQTSARHTPAACKAGESWTHHRRLNGETYVENSSNERIAEVYHEQDAALIAAAPAMFNALECARIALEANGWAHDVPKAMREIRAAIQSATL